MSLFVCSRDMDRFQFRMSERAGLDSPVLHVYCSGCNQKKATRRFQNTISNHIKSLFSFQCELINSNPRHSEALVVVQQHLFGGIPLQLLQSCGTNSNGGVKTCQNYVVEDKRELEMVF